MKCSHELVGIDFCAYYLCKCGAAWKVTTGSREAAPGDDTKGLRYFRTYEHTDPEAIRQFKRDVAEDVATL